MSLEVSVVLVAVGALAILLVAWDVVVTTLTLGEGAGPLSGKVLRWGWGRALRLHRRGEGRRSGLLTAAGPLLMVVTASLWVTTFWAGWSLIFLGSGSVVDASSGRPASVGDVVYYAGFAASSLGVGDFVATTPGWRVMTAAASFSGLALLTLSITYLFAVMSAVVTRRALATQLHSLGATAQDILLRSWDGDRFDDVLTQQLLQLPGQLAAVAEQHLAYPVLHFFRSARVEGSAPLAIARLDDALLLLESAVDGRVRPPLPAVVPLRRVIDRYLSTASAGCEQATDGDDAPPPAPRVDRLDAAGVPLTGLPERRSAFERAAERRLRLRRLVENAGWEWESV